MAKAPERLRSIAAEDLAPWTKLGFIVFRASEVTHAENKIAVKARIQSDEVAHALKAMAQDDFGVGEGYRFTWAGRSRDVRVVNVQSTTTTARSTLMHLRLDIVESQRNSLFEVTLNGQTPDDVTEGVLNTALFGGPNPLAGQCMDFMGEMPDPLQPLRDARVPDEIVRSLAELMIVDELVGTGRAARITQFQLGTAVGGLRRLELEWEPSQR